VKSARQNKILALLRRLKKVKKKPKEKLLPRSLIPRPRLLRERLMPFLMAPL
jgi:hypothetical protein